MRDKASATTFYLQRLCLTLKGARRKIHRPRRPTSFTSFKGQHSAKLSQCNTNSLCSRYTRHFSHPQIIARHSFSYVLYFRSASECDGNRKWCQFLTHCLVKDGQNFRILGVCDQDEFFTKIRNFENRGFGKNALQGLRICLVSSRQRSGTPFFFNPWKRAATSPYPGMKRA